MRSVTTVVVFRSQPQNGASSWWAARPLRRAAAPPCVIRGTACLRSLCRRASPRNQRAWGGGRGRHPRRTGPCLCMQHTTHQPPARCPPPRPPYPHPHPNQPCSTRPPSPLSAAKPHPPVPLAPLTAALPPAYQKICTVEQ